MQIKSWILTIGKKISQKRHGNGKQMHSLQTCNLERINEKQKLAKKNFKWEILIKVKKNKQNLKKGVSFKNLKTIFGNIFLMHYREHSS